MTLDVQVLEEAVYKRDFSAEARRQLADQGHALSDGSYPIPDADALGRAAILARSGHGKVAAAKALIGRRSRELGVANPLVKDEAGVSIEVDLIKTETFEAQGIVYGVVLEPDLEDSQEDVCTAAEIEKACHKFMVQSRKADRQHDGEVVKADLLENYIAPVNFDLPTPEGPKPVTKGSWLQSWKVNDPVMKQEVADGKLTGFSIGGSGVREPITA